jgi:hypothetical protein
MHGLRIYLLDSFGICNFFCLPYIIVLKFVECHLTLKSGSQGSNRNEIINPKTLFSLATLKRLEIAEGSFSTVARISPSPPLTI